METQRFSYFKKEYSFTELPNGLIVVSSFYDKDSHPVMPNFEIYIAGGRMADTETAGAGLALVQAINSDNLGIKPGIEFMASMEHAWFGLTLSCKRKSDRRPEYIARIINRIVTGSFTPAAKSLKVDEISESAGNFWGWFFEKTLPELNRLHIPSWTERMLANGIKGSEIKSFKERCFLPENIIVASHNPALHEELADRLASIKNAGSAVSRSFHENPKILSVVCDDYPKRDTDAKNADLIIYFPLPTDRYLYIKSVIAFMAVYGTGGFLKTLADRQNLKYATEVHASFWPYPFAFIRITIASDKVDKILGLIGFAPIKLTMLEPRKKLDYAQKSAVAIAYTHADPVLTARDVWLKGKTPDIRKGQVQMSLEDFNCMLQVYFSEARMGVIRGLPQLKPGTSLFSYL